MTLWLHGKPSYISMMQIELVPLQYLLHFRPTIDLD